MTAGVALVLGIACHDATGPDRQAHPLVGTYDVTTTLTSFTYGIDYPKTTVPSGPAALAGTFVIGDSAVVGTADTVVLSQFTAALAEKACDGTQPPCTGGTFDRSVVYYGPLVVTGDTTGVTGHITTGSGEQIVLRTGRLAGDSIVGTLDWYTGLGRASRYYFGTYKARRRP